MPIAEIGLHVSLSSQECRFILLNNLNVTRDWSPFSNVHIVQHGIVLFSSPNLVPAGKISLCNGDRFINTETSIITVLKPL